MVQPATVTESAREDHCRAARFSAVHRKQQPAR